MLQVSQLFIYPIKSLGGISLSRATVTKRGLEHDRRWMLVDRDGRFISQREFPVLALLIPELQHDGIKVTSKQDGNSILIPFNPLKTDLISVIIWDDICTAQLVSDDADQWFSRITGTDCRLVYMPDESERPVDPKYAAANDITSFSDGYPSLLIGQASLDELNRRLVTPVTIQRFRPNIVFTGGIAHLEDSFHTLTINDIIFNGVKLCARCNMTVIDPQTAQPGKEPMRTLATYRFKNNKILFGQNLIHGEGTMTVGDEIKVLQMHTDERFMVNHPRAAAL
jgi:uncharacterized protein YcbX